MSMLRLSKSLPAQAAFARTFATAAKPYDVVVVGGGQSQEPEQARAAIHSRPSSGNPVFIALLLLLCVFACVWSCRSRWLCRRDQGRSARSARGVRGVARHAGRHLPQRRMHPIQGAAQRVAPLPRCEASDTHATSGHSDVIGRATASGLATAGDSLCHLTCRHVSVPQLLPHCPSLVARLAVR